jgi:DNA-binding CsgD family transcriptional regulator
MGEQPIQSSQSASTSPVEVPRVVGSFQIKKQRYLMIYLGDTSEASLEFNQAPFYHLSATANPVQVNIDGQLCAVISTDSCDMVAKQDPMALLTERELQIVRLVAMGRPNKQIASRLRISEWTVSTHLRRIFAKLGVDSRAAMVYQCASIIDSINHVIKDMVQPAEVDASQ